jgi:AraC-like DNA-binding protein
VTPGHLAILPPDADTRWIFDKAGDVVFVYVSRKVFDQAVEEAMGRDPRSVEIVPRFLVRDLLLERIAQLLKEIAEPRPESTLAAEILAQELVRRDNLARPVSLQACAAAAGMSLFHFARGFRQASGRPPHRYLLELRLCEACTSRRCSPGTWA